MFVLKKLLDVLLKSPPSKEQQIQVYHRIISEIEAFGVEDDGDPNRHVEESFMPNAEFFRYKGKITHLYSDGKGRIDAKYMFNKGAASNLRLKVGDLVTCTARKLSDDQPIVIYKIDCIDEENWTGNYQDGLDFDNITPSAPIPLQSYRKWLKGEIAGKLNGEIAINTMPITPKPIKMVISEIGCTFNPWIGDQVEVEVEYGINKDNPSDHTLIGFYGMKAIDKSFIQGRITTFKKKMQYGLIDDKYIFYLDVLQHSDNQNFVPNKGDRVSSDVISSHQKIDDQEFFWRCTNLVKIWSTNGNDRHAALEIPENDGNDESDDEIDNDTCGLTITKNDALNVTLNATKKRTKIQLIVCNTSNQTHRISEVKFSNEIIASQIECPELYRYHNIRAGEQFVYGIGIIGTIRGLNKLKLDFKIDNQHLVRRCICIDVKYTDENLYAQATHSKAYTKQIYTQKRDVVKGIRPCDAPHFIDRRLENYDVPIDLFQQVMNSTDRYELSPKQAETFSTLTVHNYGDYFHDLLYFEEIFMRHEFRVYDQDRGHFIRDGEYLAYEMNKNVFECRPSIIIGDTIHAQSLLQSNHEQIYEGYIHKIRSNRLLLKFDDEFHSKYLGEDYKLVFRFSRSKLKKQHNAIARIAQKMDPKKGSFEFLFPKKIESSKRLQLDVQLVDGDLVLKFPKQIIPWYNKKLNDIQKQAVFNVLRGEVKMCPYLVFGPPGTGKTSTLIEIILQLYRKGNSRLIVAAPSNSAANLITKLLAECGALKAGEFARIVSRNSIERDQIPDELREHCITADIAAPRSKLEPQNPIENGIRVQCNSDMISLHRILISTCMTFGSLLNMKFKQGHFTHAIIDEAGQCTEPEIAIPISLIDKNDGQIILAGDPHQLGPVVLSPIAKKCGLSKSLLSRLLDHLPYRPDVGRGGGFDGRMVTQLLHNYRSLPSILRAYSNMSYESKLIANISDVDSDEQKLLAMVQATMHPSTNLKHSKNYGVYFMGIVGRDETTSDSTSWRNPQEVLEVTTVVHQLFECGLTEDDIGIITPYTLQVREIRFLGDTFFNGKQPKIGSVEEFQGQERRVIIISTVRSKRNYISHDGKYGLGFINNKNRVNVAISRARAILIIIGNPYILGVDENWRQLIYDCYINGSYSGCQIPNGVLQHTVE